MKYICSLIVVEDIDRSRRLYETILKQDVKTDFGENVCFHGDFAIHQASHFRALTGGAPVTRKANNFELYFEEDELEPVVEQVRQEGLEFIHGITEQPWRQKVVRFYDYDGNIIEIGERLEHTAWRLSQEGLPLEEISGITYLPPEEVKKAIREFSE